MSPDEIAKVDPWYASRRALLDRLYHIPYPLPPPPKVLALRQRLEEWLTDAEFVWNDADQWASDPYAYYGVRRSDF